MKSRIYETKQRSEELMAEAARMWRQSNQSEQIEGLENDPVFSLLMSAVAYQANEIDDEIERIKSDVVEQMCEMLTPYEMSHAVPATAVVAVNPAPGVASVDVDSRMTFLLSGGGYKFMPVLKSRVLPVKVDSVARLDGRRWNVTLSFDAPLTDISLLTFTVSNCLYRDLELTMDGKHVPLIKPWEYGNLPFCDCFSLSNSLFSYSSYNPASANMDLFARQDIRMYVIHHSAADMLAQEVNKLNVVFEFKGIGEDFTFDKNSLIFNTVLLANVIERDVTLDASKPVARVAGSSSDEDIQFMQVLRPGIEQLCNENPVRVRSVAADRFNQGTLVKLLSSLLGKVKSDYYAFQYMDMNKGSEALDNIKDSLKKLRSLADSGFGGNLAGTYLIMNKKSASDSLKLSYLVTNGAKVNASLNSGSIFVPPALLDSETIRQIGNPVPGTDEFEMEGGATEITRYVIQTNGRIVTHADIRAFCYKELLNRYAIQPSMVSNVAVEPRLVEGRSYHHNNCGYEIAVQIDINDTPFIRRSFTDKIPQAEVILEKMMTVRSVNIYPIKVKIEIK